MAVRSVILMAVVILAILSAPRARAETITFDQPITGAASPTDVGPGLALDYNTPTLVPPTTFQTQGYTFSGFTDPVTTGNTQPDLAIIVDPSLCNSLLGISCLDNGTDYLGTADPFALLLSGSTYSLLELDAGQVFPEGGCPGCADGSDLPNATVLQLTGFRNGMIVAEETLVLTSSFQTFILTDPDWSEVNRTVFVARNGDISQGFAGIDNIVVEPVSPTAVPEPSTLLLLGAGLVGFMARYRPVMKG